MKKKTQSILASLLVCARGFGDMGLREIEDVLYVGVLCCMVLRECLCRVGLGWTVREGSSGKRVRERHPGTTN